MTTQAKNKLLAFIAIVMLVIIAIACNMQLPPKTANIMLPKRVPVLVTVEEPSYNKTEFECMRTNLYFEAGNQGKRGMEAVALVTLNRTKTKHYPSTVCGVVNQYATVRGRKICQFSWRCDSKSNRPRLHNDAERESWERATLVAERAMNDTLNDFLGRATHYHADYVNPKWANVPKRYRRVAVVGTHIFYRDVALKLKA